MIRIVMLFLCCCPVLLRAQEYYIDWANEAKRSVGLILSVLPDKGSDFYTYNQSGAQILQLPKVTRYENGVPVITKRISQRLGDNVVSLEEMEVFGGQLLGFMSDKRDGRNSLYMVRYDSDIDPIGEPEMINAYDLPKSWSHRGFFNVLASRNKRFLCVEYIIPARRDDFERYGYKVIDTSFQVVAEGEYELPYKSKNANVELRYLTDNGDYILGIAVYSDSRGSVWKDYNALEKTVLVQVGQDELTEYELNIEGKRVFDIGLGALDSTLIVTGTYGEPFSTGSQGVFMQRINLRSRQVINDCFHLFPRDFMTQDMTPAQIDKLERRETRGRTGPQLYNYAIRAVHPLADGSTVVVAEQFFIYQQNTTDTKGISQTMYHYYFNDVVTYKIDSAGNFNWIVRMPKEQHSVNDYGYYSSIKTLIDGDKLLCFFNDNRKNYDEAGAYIGFLRGISFPVRKKSYALAMGQLDLSSGTVKRTVLNEYAESNGFVVLRLSPVDYRNKQMLIYAEGRRFRFGILRY